MSTQTQGAVAETGRAFFPLSSNQQRVFRLDRSIPGYAFSPVTVRLHGSLDVPALCASIQEIVRRHEMLRTVFPVMRGIPVQMVCSHLTFVLSIVDLGGLPAKTAEAIAAHLAWAVSGRPFDTARGPLFRWMLLRIGRDDHILSGTLHHLIFDGGSEEILFRELTALYAARRSGPPLEAPIVRYRDFVAAERTPEHQRRIQQALSYWRRRLAPPLHPLRLPFDHPRPTLPSYNGDRVDLSFESSAISASMAFARTERATMFMMALAVLGLLLSTYSEGDDVVVGTPVRNRASSAAEALIGPFVNIVVIRTRLSDDLTFRKLVRNVRELTLEAWAHQEAPFDEVLRMLWPGRALGNYGAKGEPALFQACFDFHAVPKSHSGSSGLALLPFEFGETIVGCDLLLALQQGEDSLKGHLAFSTDLFDKKTGLAMARDYQALFARAVCDSDLPVSSLRSARAETHYNG